MSFGRGLKRSHPSKLARRVGLELHPRVAAVLSAGLPDAFDLAQYEPPVFDQGQTSACTWHATSAGLVVAFAADGKPLGFIPSMDLGYKLTRALERAKASPAGATLPPLADSGAELTDVYTVCGEYGVKPMAEAMTSDGRFSDVETSHVNDEPAISDVESAAQHLIVGPYGVDPTAANASDVLAAALVAGVPVGVACYVASAFEGLGANDVAQPADESDPNGGGHALLLTGFRAVSGARQFRVRNSWSASWSDAGRCWASEAWRASLWEAHPLAVS